MLLQLHEGLPQGPTRHQSPVLPGGTRSSQTCLGGILHGQMLVWEQPHSRSVETMGRTVALLKARLRTVVAVRCDVFARRHAGSSGIFERLPHLRMGTREGWGRG